jgi:hypothetical protein
MSKLLFFIGLTFSSLFAFGQFNDTIFYNSGNYTIAEVVKFDKKQIKFYTKNEKGDTITNSDGLFKLSRFVCYDGNNILQYDSKNITSEITQNKFDQKYPDSLDISRHEVSINPFLPIQLSFSAFHKFNFGKKRQFSIISRLSSLNFQSEFDYPSNSLNIGTGFLWTMFRNNRFSMGLDYSLLFGVQDFGSSVFFGDFRFALPVTLNLDLYFNKFIGLRLDVGFFEFILPSYQEFLIQVDLGILFLFPNKKRVATNY